MKLVLNSGSRNAGAKFRLMAADVKTDMQPLNAHEELDLFDSNLSKRKLMSCCFSVFSLPN